MKTASSRPGLTEQFLADRFQEVITSADNSVPRVPIFQATYREVSCAQGIADFVGVVRPTGRAESEAKAPLSLNCSLSAASRVLGALVTAQKPVAANALAASTGLSPRVVSHTLQYLMRSSLVRAPALGWYSFPSESAVPWPDMWAFEVKLSNWHRAVFQALQYAAFASHVLVIMPQSKSKVAIANRDLFGRLGVGLLLFDPYTGHTRQVAPARRIGPASAAQAVYAAGRILTLDAVTPARERRNTLNSVSSHAVCSEEVDDQNLDKAARDFAEKFC